MAVNGDQITGENGELVLTGGTYTILPNATVGSIRQDFDVPALNWTPTTTGSLVVYGRIYKANATALHVAGEAAFLSVRAGGSIEGSRAYSGDAGNFAIFGTVFTIDNYGTINGVIVMTGFNRQVVATISNFATMTSKSSLLWVNDPAVESTTVANTGSMSARLTTIVVESGRVFLTNWGTIVSRESNAITANDGGQIVNYGTIVGRYGAIGTVSGNTTVLNAGHIVGTVVTGSGMDRYDGASGDVTADVRLGAADDVAIGGAAVDRLFGEDGSDTLSGNGGNDMLDGGEGNDVLDGGAGNDRMTGGTGNDTFYVDEKRDVVIEAAAGGDDIVYAAESYALGAGQEIETLATDPNAGVQGLALTGNEYAQTITGDAGDNVLTGGGGADTLVGLGGNDAYVVSDAGTVIVEQADGGHDVVTTSVSYTLAAEVEELRAAAWGAIDLTGNAGANLLKGNAFDNVLDGGAGADVMNGGAGDDTYFVDDPGDVIIDQRGVDAVRATASYTLGRGLENLTLLGAAAIDGTGNSAANVIVGNAGDNRLDGRGGLDSLTGGDGADTFAFTATAKATNAVTITDFASGVDRIALDNAVFTKLGLDGALGEGVFSDAGAVSRASVLLYDQASGVLSYDRDGSGSAVAVAFAHLGAGTELSASDIMVI